MPRLQNLMFLCGHNEVCILSLVKEFLYNVPFFDNIYEG
jgi:hypothetical protein